MFQSPPTSSAHCRSICGWVLQLNLVNRQTFSMDGVHTLADLGCAVQRSRPRFQPLRQRQRHTRTGRIIGLLQTKTSMAQKRNGNKDGFVPSKYACESSLSPFKWPFHAIFIPPHIAMKGGRMWPVCHMWSSYTAEAWTS